MSLPSSITTANYVVALEEKGLFGKFWARAAGPDTAVGFDFMVHDNADDPRPYRFEVIDVDNDQLLPQEVLSVLVDQDMFVASSLFEAPEPAMANAPAVLQTCGGFKDLQLAGSLEVARELRASMTDHDRGVGIYRNNQHGQLVWVFEDEDESELVVEAITAGPLITDLQVATLDDGVEVLVLPIEGGFRPLDASRLPLTANELTSAPVPFEALAHVGLLDEAVRHARSEMTPGQKAASYGVLVMNWMRPPLGVTWVQQVGDLAILYEASLQDRAVARGGTASANIQGQIERLSPIGLGLLSVSPEGSARLYIDESKKTEYLMLAGKPWADTAFRATLDRLDELRRVYPDNVPPHPSARRLDISFNTNTVAFDESDTVRDNRIAAVYQEALHWVKTQGLNQAGFGPLQDINGAEIGSLRLVSADAPFPDDPNQASMSISLPTHADRSLQAQVDAVVVAIEAGIAAIKGDEHALECEDILRFVGAEQRNPLLDAPDPVKAFARQIAHLYTSDETGPLGDTDDAEVTLNALILKARELTGSAPGAVFESDADLEHSA